MLFLYLLFDFFLTVCYDVYSHFMAVALKKSPSQISHLWDSEVYFDLDAMHIKTITNS